MVRLLIEIPQNYRINFDIQINECYMNGLLILDNGISLTPYFPQPTKPSQGVMHVDFKLFRRLVDINADESLVVMDCNVETCLDSCDEEGKRKRRSSVGILISKMPHSGKHVYASINSRLGLGGLLR